MLSSIRPDPLNSSAPKTSLIPGSSPISEATPVDSPNISTKEPDPKHLESLRRTLEEQLQTNFNSATPVAETVSYEVMLGQDGKILDYRPENPAANDLVNQTPLPQLRYNPVPGGDVYKPMASFRAEFTPEGAVRVQSMATVRATTAPNPAVLPEQSPNATETKPDTPVARGSEIRQRSKLVELQPKLYDRIDQAWKAPNGVTFKEKLIYSVRVDGAGKVIDYAPYDQTAANFKAETPMASLGKEGKLDKTPEGTFARFKVVFNPNGQLEVKPWDGYSDS
jgi:hypothetical protein